MGWGISPTTGRSGSINARGPPPRRRSGTVTNEQYGSCSGDTCGPSENYACTTVTTFVGTEVTDVDLGYGVSTPDFD